MKAKELRRKEIAQKLKNLRIEANLTQAQVAEKLGLTYQAVSNYERGINSIETDVLFAMCDMYHVDPVSVLRPGLYLCPVCGMNYDSSFAPDVDEHNRFHKSFCKAQDHFGDCCIPRSKWGSLKASAYDVLNSDEANTNDKAEAMLNLIKVYFSKSLDAWGYNLNHPMFNDYTAMLLNQTRFKEYDESAYNVLLSKYGKKPGMPENETTYMIRDLINHLNSSSQIMKIKTAPSNFSEEAKQIAKDYDGLTEHGKGAVRAVLEYEKAHAFETSNIITLRRTKEMMVYNDAAAAGVPLYADSDFQRMEFPEDEIPAGADFGVKISGDSMEPTIPDGAIAWVRRTQELQDGQIGIFMIDASSVCKRFRTDGTKVWLESDNEKYEPIKLEDFTRLGIVGRVLNYK